MPDPIETAALADGVHTDIVYWRRPEDGAIFISRDDLVEFLMLAGHFDAADLMRRCGAA